MPKVLLIEPPYYRLFKDTYSLNRMPLSLGYLASAIKARTSWEVSVYNSDFLTRQPSQFFQVSYLAGEGFTRYLENLKDLSAPIWKEIDEVLRSERPEVVGISAKSQNFKSACHVARLVKQMNPAIPVVMGGPHPTMVRGDVFSACPDIDICVMGEGEETIVELLTAIEKKIPYENLRGLTVKNGAKPAAYLPREFIASLDQLPSPYRYVREVLRDFEKYPLTSFQYIFATRGCPYKCFFCGSRMIWSRKVRHRSPANVLEEIRLLKDMNVPLIHFDDDTFGVNKQYIRDLCGAIVSEFPHLHWSCELHANLVDDEIITLMKRSGCARILIGVESGNNEILKKIEKNVTIEMLEEKCALIHQKGIFLTAFIIVGFPFDTVETIRDTTEAIKRLRCDEVLYSIFTPYPGTEAFEYCRARGLVDESFDASLFNHQSPANYFCPNIPREEFVKMCREIEHLVDRKNYLSRFKRILRLNPLEILRAFGLKKTLKKLYWTVTGR